jgi:hypothetical protein
LRTDQGMRKRFSMNGRRCVEQFDVERIKVEYENVFTTKP